MLYALTVLRNEPRLTFSKGLTLLRDGRTDRQPVKSNPYVHLASQMTQKIPPEIYFDVTFTFRKLWTSFEHLHTEGHDRNKIQCSEEKRVRLPRGVYNLT